MTYQSILLRDNMQDTGSGRSQGAAYLSPDIIPVPSSNLDPLSIWNTYGPSSYNRDFQYSTVTAGSPNYIYVRGKNLASTAVTGAAKLYWAPASLLLSPTQWQSNELTAPDNTFISFQPGTASTLIPAPPNSVCVVKSAFAWTPRTPNPGDHYCLIGLAATNNQWPPIPSSFTTTDDFIAWVQGDSGVAWHNLGVNTNAPPTYKWNVTAGNASKTDSVFYLFVNITDPHGMMARGGTVVVYAPLPGFPQTWNVDPSLSNVFRFGIVKPNTTFPVTITAAAPGGQALTGVGFDTIWTTTVGSQAHPAAKFALQPTAFLGKAAKKTALRSQAKSLVAGIPGLYHLGDFTMQFPAGT